MLAINQIALLPDSFSPLQSLTSLALQRNQLRALPPSICECKNLVSLLVSHNLLKSLPEEFGKLEKLTSLHVDNNQFFKGFPSSMANCVSLKVSAHFTELLCFLSDFY